MKILVTGDRNWKDAKLIETEILGELAWLGLMSSRILIHGNAKGADTLADTVAQLLDFDEIKAYPAQWNKYGRAAGILRNQQMLDENPDIDLVLAFHDDLDNSKGTKDMVNRAEKAGIPVRKIKHEL